MSVKKFKAYSYLGNYDYIVFNNIDSLINTIKNDNYSLLVIDSQVNRYFKKFEKKLDFKKILVEVNEETKSVEKLVYFLRCFSELELTRNSKILIIGGATMQDIFASVCCLYFRGIEWSFVPTTILSQGDSCVGSKTSLDGFGKKNQFGVFYPPKKIYVCNEFLNTLPNQEIYSGIGDVIHYLLPYDINNLFLSKIINLATRNEIHELINYSVFLSSKAMAIKGELVKIDEFDKGPRKVFNFGHTFGHTIEKSSTKYIPHGLAVLCGIYIALNFEHKETSISNICSKQKILIKELLEIIFKSENITLSIRTNDLRKHLKSDKKNTRPNKIRVIVPTSLNNALWTSNNESAIYGLNYIDTDIEYCESIFRCLEHIQYINFVN